MKPLIPEETVKTEEAPNYEVLAAEERVRKEAIEARLKEKEAEFDQKMAALAQQRNQVVPQQEVATPQQQAAFELGMTEEEIAANPGAAMERMKTHMEQRDGQYREAITRAGYVMNNLAQTTHDSQVSSLRDRDFYENAEPMIRAYYEQNPREKIPGMGRTPDEVYNIVIGQNWKQWEKERQAKDPGPDPNLAQPPNLPTGRAPAAIETPLRPPGRSGTDTAPKEKEVKLSPEKEKIRKHYNSSFKTNISAAEWVAIESGKVLPKQAKGAADWQVHGRPDESVAAVDE